MARKPRDIDTELAALMQRAKKPDLYAFGLDAVSHFGMMPELGRRRSWTFSAY